MKQNTWPIPHLQTTLVNILKQQCFSTLDLKETFYSVELSPSSIPKSAIITPWGQYEYLRSNFELKGSMNAYCRMIASVQGHLKRNDITNYLYDTISLGEDFDKHLVNIENKLEAFSKNRLILKIDKCQSTAY